MSTITITRALTQLKTAGGRIEKVINDGTFVGMTYATPTDEDAQKRKVDEIKSSFQSVTDLIEYHSLLKRRIAQSNAVTTVTIGGKEYTVTEALAAKETMRYNAMLLSKLKYAYTTTVAKLNKSQEAFRESLNEFVERQQESLKDIEESADILAKRVAEYTNKNQLVLQDPIGIVERINELEKEVNSFQEEIDYALSESNATTTIEVD